MRLLTALLSNAHAAADQALIRHRLFRGTVYEPAAVLARRVVQVGRLSRRLRRATAALEDALLAVHEAEARHH